MFAKMFTLMLGFGCGVMYIRTLSVEHPFIITEFLLNLILDPVQFFFGMVFFFVSFIAHAHLLKEALEETYKWVKGKKGNILGLTMNYFVLLPFFLLLLLGVWETVILASFSIFYSILSIDVSSYQNAKIES